MLPSPTLTGYVLKAAVRDRLAVSILLLMLASACLSVFVGSSAVVESDQFALVFAAGSIRFAGMVGLVLFVVFYVRRAFESRDIDFILARPVSRISFILSHTLAFSLIAVFVAIVASGAIAGVSPRSFSYGTILWSLSLAVEFMIMANVALSFSLTLSSPVAASLSCFGLYALARLTGEIFGILNVGLSLPFYRMIAIALHFISLIVPRFDLMAQTSWLVYGPGVQDIGVPFILAQLLVYGALYTATALVDLARRQF